MIFYTLKCFVFPSVYCFDVVLLSTVSMVRKSACSCPSFTFDIISVFVENYTVLYTAYRLSNIILRCVKVFLRRP